MASAAIVKGEGKLPEVESLRGIAILLVVLFHLHAMVGRHSFATPAETSLAGAFVLAGHTGVSLFFVLSGFLLARPFLTEAAGGAHVARRAYAARRVRRVMPAYVAAVTVASIDCATRPLEVLRGVPYLFFLESIPEMTTPLVPYSDVWWTLATEAQFYLALPLLAWAWRAGRRLVCLLAVMYALAYAAVVTGVIVIGTPGGTVALLGSLFGRGPLFMLGTAAAWILPEAAERSKAWARRSSWVAGGAADVVLLLLLVGLALLLRRVVAASYLGAELGWPWWHVIEGALWASVLLLLLVAPLRSKLLLCNPVLGRLGLWSYSLYLIHFPLIWYVFDRRHATLRPVLDTWGVPPAARPALVLAVSIVLAALSYQIIERPFLRRAPVQRRA
jgi:peptidoglycan/LPS O-acetylase OafA/YrhL